MRNPALSPQVSGYFAEFRHVGRDFPESRPFTEEPAGWRGRGPPNSLLLIPWRYFHTVGHGIVGGARSHPFCPNKWRFR